MKLNQALSILLLLVFHGCASVTYEGQFKKINSNIRDTKTEDKVKKMRWKDADDIIVYNSDNLPTGIKFNKKNIKNGIVLRGEEYNNNLSLAPEYELIGEAYAESIGTIFNSNFTDYPEDEKWRNGYCKWQAPLNWVTLHLWMLVPLNYPCSRSEPFTQEGIEKSKMRITKTLKMVVKSAGGDILVINQIGHEERGTGFLGLHAIHSFLYYNAGKGYVIRKRKIKDK